MMDSKNTKMQQEHGKNDFEHQEWKQVKHDAKQAASSFNAKLEARNNIGKPTKGKGRG